MPFDALGMCVGPDEGAEDEWDSKQLGNGNLDNGT